MLNRISVLAAVSCGCVMAGTVAAGATTLRFSDYGPNRGSRAEALQWFADELKSQSKGELDVQFFWGGALLSGKDTLQGVGDGVADMGTIVGFFTPRELRAYNMADLPVDNSDIWIGLRAVYDLATGNQAMQKEFADAHVHYLTNYSTGPVQLICKKDVSGSKGLQGLKIRASGPYGDALRMLGVDVVNMSQADVYQALDSGLVDCNQNYYYSILAYRQYEVAKHILELDWGQNMSFGIVMNQATYDSLPDGQKKVLADVSSKFEDHLAQTMIEEEASAKKKMANGIDGEKIEITPLSPEARNRLMDASDKAIDQWAAAAKKDGIDSAALLADYRKLIDKYKSEKATGGYPWTR